jgi:hypothetical protein
MVLSTPIRPPAAARCWRGSCRSPPLPARPAIVSERTEAECGRPGDCPSVPADPSGQPPNELAPEATFPLPCYPLRPRRERPHGMTSKTGPGQAASISSELIPLSCPDRSSVLTRSVGFRRSTTMIPSRALLRASSANAFRSRPAKLAAADQRACSAASTVTDDLTNRLACGPAGFRLRGAGTLTIRSPLRW